MSLELVSLDWVVWHMCVAAVVLVDTGVLVADVLVLAPRRRLSAHTRCLQSFARGGSIAEPCCLYSLCGGRRRWTTARRSKQAKHTHTHTEGSKPSHRAHAKLPSCTLLSCARQSRRGSQGKLKPKQCCVSVSERVWNRARVLHAQISARTNSQIMRLIVKGQIDACKNFGSAADAPHSRLVLILDLDFWSASAF